MSIRSFAVALSFGALVAASGAQAQTASPSPQPTPAATALPASSLSLDEALRRVSQDNPALWRLRQEQALWPARIQQAGIGLNPEVSLVGEDYAGSAAFTDDRFTQFTLGLAQTLVLGNKLEARVRLAQAQQQLAYWDYRLQLRSLGHDVYQAYVRILTLDAE